MPTSRLGFFSDCTAWPLPVQVLKRIIEDAKDIRRSTFLQHVDPAELKRLEADLGYAAHPSRGLTMAKDWHVSYHKSQFRGCPVAFFVWSAIEYVFADAGCLSRAAEEGK